MSLTEFNEHRKINNGYTVYVKWKNHDGEYHKFMKVMSDIIPRPGDELNLVSPDKLTSIVDNVEFNTLFVGEKFIPGDLVELSSICVFCQEK